MKKSVAVLGLGKFGSSIARSLAKGGAEVLAVDKDEDLVRASHCTPTASYSYVAPSAPAKRVSPESRSIYSCTACCGT